MKTLEDLTAAVIAAMPDKVTLVYIAYDDKLMDEQVDMLVRDDFEALYSSTDEWEGDSRYEGAEYILKELAADVIKGWEAEDETGDLNFTFDDLLHDWLGSEEFDEARYALEERDDSDIFGALARNTPDVLLRISVVDEDDAWSFEEVPVDAFLVKVGLPDTEQNRKAAADVIANASPEYGVGMVYALVDGDVGDILKWGDKYDEVDLVNPDLWLGNPFSGSGWASSFEGTIRVKREDLHTDKGAFGYSWNEVVGGGWHAENSSIVPVEKEEA